MKKKLIFLLLLFPFTAFSQTLNSLPLDQEEDIRDICLIATSQQFAINESVAKDDLNKIFSSLGLSYNNIEVIKCDRLRNSALAYYDNTEHHYYILVNENRLTGLNDNYYSHLFVVAHEFAHIKKNHLGTTTIVHQSAKRNMELEADKYAAGIVKQMGGTVNDCIYALQQMNHPADDTYSDHPTLERRITAVTEGFESSVTPTVVKNYTDYLPDFTNVSLLKYTNELNEYDINAYHEETGLVPNSIVYLNGNYWIYWDKDDDVEHYKFYWGYEYYPGTEVQSNFDEGYNIKFLEKINGRWFLVMFKYPQSFAQYTRVLAKNNITNLLKPYADNYYSVQNIIDDGPNYFVLLTKKNDWQHYSWAIRGTYQGFEDWYRTQINNNYTYMYCMKKLEDGFFAFMTDNPDVSNWSITSFNGNDATNLINKLNDGYMIDNVTCDTYMRFTLKK